MALSENYANGFRFDVTALRLLSTISNIEISDDIQTALKNALFRRNDDLYFLPDVIANKETLKEIVEFANEFLDEYGFFEISKLYTLFENDINDKAIDDEGNFENFYQFINDRDVRCVATHGTRIARLQNKNRDTLFTKVANKITDMIRDEFHGAASEDDIMSNFDVISIDLLSSIIKDYADELVRTEINGIACFQTLETLGLPNEFSEILSDVLMEIDDLGLVPSEEVLHTALSLRMGVNFKAEYNIPNDKTYRYLIAYYYDDTSKREWRYGKFAEV
jgi:hypothetical protein